MPSKENAKLVFPEVLTLPKDLPRVIFLDLDGTLLNSQHQFSPKTQETLKNFVAQAQALKLVICTGRHPANLLEILPFFHQLDADGLHIASGGASIVSAEGQIVQQVDLEPHLVREICYQVETWGGSYGFGHDLTFYVGEQMMLRRMSKEQHIPANYFLTKEIDDLEQWRSPLIVIDGLNEQIEAYVNKLVVRGKLAAKRMRSSRTGQLYYQLTPPKVNKMTAVNWYAQHQGIEPAQAWAVGDTAIDQELLAGVGLGIAVANANAELRELAKLVLPWTNDQDAVAKLLRLVQQRLAK